MEPLHFRSVPLYELLLKVGLADEPISDPEPVSMEQLLRKAYKGDVPEYVPAISTEELLAKARGGTP